MNSASTLQMQILEFDSRGERCVGTLYLPEHSGPHPVVVMAHGFAAERTFGLPAFAERFAAGGMAVFLFDYRSFGDSDGEPRHVVSFRRQRQDWQSALDFVKTLDGVDPARTALWGSSYSGGHTIVTAANNPEVAAIVSQVPMVDGRGSLRVFSIGYQLSATLRAVWDVVRSWFRMRPYYVPVFAPPGTFAALNQPGCAEGYQRLIPPDSSWENRVAAREMLYLLWNRPIRYADAVKCPALIVLANGEQLIPLNTIRKAARRILNATLVESDGDHFDVYFDEEFERMVTLQTDFLSEHLLGETRQR